MIFPKLNLCGSNPSKDEVNLYQTYSLAGNVLIEIDKETPIKEVLTPLLIAKFATNWVQLPKYDNADELSDVMLNILDSGASKVVIPYPQPFSNDILIKKFSQFPEDRLSILLNYKTQKETLDIINQFNPYVSAFIINSNDAVCPLSKPISKTLSQKENFEREIYSKELTQIHAVAKKHKLFIDLLKVKPSSQLITNLDELSFNLILGSDKLAIGVYKNNKGDVTDDGKIDIGAAYSASLITDRPDNLHSTVVVDEQGVALGLAYSDAESISEAFRTRQGVYKSRSRGLWYKGLTSNSVQQLLRIDADCDKDTIRFTVHQTGTGFCHLNTRTCFGDDTGITALEAALKKKFTSAPDDLFKDEKLLRTKIIEEATGLSEANEKDKIASEAADVIFFTLAKCIANGVTLSDIENHLDRRSKKIAKRTVAADEEEKKLDFSLRAFDSETITAEQRKALEKRPIFSSANISNLVNPIIENVRKNGDKAIKELTEKFDGVKLDSVVIEGPFTETPAELSKEVIDSIDLAFDNLVKFHKAQLEPKPLQVETCPGVNCSRYVRSIEKVGLYVPGGTAVLPSTTMHLGVPALVAGCSEIILATPPRKDGSIVPEVLYVAKKINAKMIVKAGGAQAIAAMAYGTESVPKVDKICGPGNQFVTAAKMFVQNDHSALVSIDMPAGPSEVLVIADGSAKPEYIAADLLSQAEHGKDSQSVFVAVNLTDEQFKAIEDQVKKQGTSLPRANIAKYAIGNSFALRVKTLDEAIAFSNAYAPEHLIINVDDMENKKDEIINKVTNAGSVFLGNYTTESCGDYASGTNHTLPTYGYARMYSGTNTGSFLKHITAQYITKEGLKNIGPAVMKLAECESLDAHRNAVAVRMKDFQEGITTVGSTVYLEAKTEEEKKLDFSLRAFDSETITAEQRKALEKRPIFSSANISNLVNPIIENVRKNGDKAIKELTEKFDGVKLDSVVIEGPFTETPAELSKEVIDSIDLAFDNLVKFHKAQLEPKPLQVETCPGVNCSRYVRSIEKVGLYVPGGTAVLPSTTMHLGVPALVAGCSEIILATPPRKDGSIVPEVLYVAKKINAKMIVKAGGAQAIAAMAYGTESVPKVDKICGPGNQFVTAAKMFVQNDHSALVSIDMPAGPSEVLVIGDDKANPEYIAADLLSQAEHGKDSQSVYIAVNLTDEQFKAVEDQVKKQGACLPRANIAKYAIGNSFALRVKTLDEAIAFSNAYAPEHLIINVDDMENKKDEIINKITNAGSVFLGGYTTESCGDYASGTNHTLPTYGYARMYSGTNTGSFLKHITAQYITKEGLKNIGPAVMKLAECESLDAHRNAVAVRMKDIQN
ncbi:hypothetical protein BCR32DRAFT_298374 [Anaeromyces robustus]|uniref:Phosphoribosyl-AMP cyclohydrolase domain-containing protein n=1 Tax=Anaeromyces robustus TaxID=1754192 RepID=A0A1Y1VQQ2_9FUNG|nr:hypothetical protein BCR32DRAFT_298374 [Anaeromyces robustus]|eukprot:ORX63622.1 hypothetical protein BCR32DRAFT_298374 [Anaeromyces robustus]